MAGEKSDAWEADEVYTAQLRRSSSNEHSSPSSAFLLPIESDKRTIGIGSNREQTGIDSARKGVFGIFEGGGFTDRRGKWLANGGDDSERGNNRQGSQGRAARAAAKPAGNRPYQSRGPRRICRHFDTPTNAIPPQPKAQEPESTVFLGNAAPPADAWGQDMHHAARGSCALSGRICLKDEAGNVFVRKRRRESETCLKDEDQSQKQGF
ncbi:uncharacterized protein MKK02DRAFT_30659 [Dioszegia hungarica]|uniref:Uncharacterized protein n=1 Tax=Dioszegia hungarica TaxID=4972 RepID=A0AA38LQL7_9TREE|nr:uncharacterized protein MKK02DRAFT_30659 [Dioszegia hungarica]KAI9632115.1 hypothetical protein MKK02DRAFT_30659 [Dioszegia hungarica]